MALLFSHAGTIKEIENIVFADIIMSITHQDNDFAQQTPSYTPDKVDMVAPSHRSTQTVDDGIKVAIMSNQAAGHFSGAKRSLRELEEDLNNATKEHHVTGYRMEELLLSKGLLSRDQLEVALKQQRESDLKRHLGEILVELGFITNTALSSVLTEATGIKSFDLNSATLDVGLVKKIPKNIALQHKIIPISLDGDCLSIATSDVYNILAFDQIKRYFHKNLIVTPLYADEAHIREAIDLYFEYEMSIEGILREIERESANNQRISGEEGGYINPTVRLVDAVLSDAIKRGASDIHFEPEQSFVRLRYRIDGVLIPMITFHKDYWPAIVVRIKIVGNMNIAETRNPQDGRISYNILGRFVDFRLASQPTVYGENIVARILDRNRALMQIDDLDMSEHNKRLLMRLLKRPEGIIIVTGPTGCGKTTTLYSVLSYLNKTDINIMTLEDPVEYQLPLIRQSGVREGTNMSFANGVRSMLRQDPDIIFVGEVRDSDTATMTMRASMTGHLVFTTLHTNDAYGVIPRLTDLGLQPALLSGTIICAIAQRLARRLCMACREQYTATNEECVVLGINPQKAPKLYRHTGCSICYHSGYKGRIAVHEILPIDSEIDDMIARSASRKEILGYAVEHGFIPMAEDGILKVLAGITDLEEIMGTVNLTHRMQ